MAADEKFIKMAREYLLDCAECDKILDGLVPPGDPFPEDWLEALATELDAALSDRVYEWVETLKAGRSPTQFIVDWQAAEGVCPCEPGNPDDQCPVHGFEAWKRRRQLTRS